MMYFNNDCHDDISPLEYSYFHVIIIVMCVVFCGYIRQVTVPPPTNADGTGGTGPDVQKTILHSVFGVAAPGQMVALMGMRCVNEDHFTLFDNDVDSIFYRLRVMDCWYQSNEL
jgi:hypothetical protein